MPALATQIAQKHFVLHTPRCQGHAGDGEGQRQDVHAPHRLLCRSMHRLHETLLLQPAQHGFVTGAQTFTALQECSLPTAPMLIGQYNPTQPNSSNTPAIHKLHTVAVCEWTSGWAKSTS